MKHPIELILEVVFIAAFIGGVLIAIGFLYGLGFHIAARFV